MFMNPTDEEAARLQPRSDFPAGIARFNLKFDGFDIIKESYTGMYTQDLGEMFNDRTIFAHYNAKTKEFCRSVMGGDEVITYKDNRCIKLKDLPTHNSKYTYY